MGIAYKAIKQISITRRGPFHIAVESIGRPTLVNPEIIETVSEMGLSQEVHEGSL